MVTHWNRDSKIIHKKTLRDKWVSASKGTLSHKEIRKCLLFVVEIVMWKIVVTEWVGTWKQWPILSKLIGFSSGTPHPWWNLSHSITRETDSVTLTSTSFGTSEPNYKPLSSFVYSTTVFFVCWNFWGQSSPSKQWFCLESGPSISRTDSWMKSKAFSRHIRYIINTVLHLST